MLRAVRAGAILAGFLALTLPLMPVQLLLVRLGSRHARTFPHRYHRWVCRLIGLRLNVHGTVAADRPVLIVSNHVSWLDIPVLSAVAPISFVAKSEVGTWPLVGALARLQRTVFVDRKRRVAVGDVTSEMASRLGQGDHIVLFGSMDGTDLHYLDMVGDAGRALAALPEAVRGPAALAILTRHFGSDMPARVEVLHVTSWSADPYARAGWALARLGAAPLRARLRDPYGRLFFAGEAASQGQWGTVGGAWGEGERAARQALDLIGTAPVA